MIDLQGKTALVTGGSRGIGRACCELLARAGARVAVNYRLELPAAEEVVRKIEQFLKNARQPSREYPEEEPKWSYKPLDTGFVK